MHKNDAIVPADNDGYNKNISLVFLLIMPTILLKAAKANLASVGSMLVLVLYAVKTVGLSKITCHKWMLPLS